MSNSDIVKGIEIIDEAAAIETFEKQVRSKGLPVLQVGSDKTIYAVGENEQEREKFNEVVEENAFALNLDYARAKLFYVNKETGQIRESKKIMDRFLSESDIDDMSEGIPISLLPDLMDFVGESNALTEEDIAEVFQEKNIEGDAVSTTIQEKGNMAAESDKSDDVEDDSEDDFIDDVEDPLQQKQEQAATAEATLERDPEIEEYPEPKQEDAPVQNKDEMNQNPEMEEKENQDYLMKKAIELFDNHNPMSLPVFDELTTEGLQDRIVSSQFEVRKARDQGIHEVYHRLKDEASESMETIRSNVIESARKKHEEVIQKIDRNYKYDVEKLLNEHNAEYEKDRENYIQSQIPLLRKQYDAEYYPNYESVLNEEIERLREQSNKDKNVEIEQFQSYVDQVLNENQEKVVNAVPIDDIIEKYNKVAEEQKSILLYEAEQKKSEIGTRMQEMVQERDRLKQEIDEVQGQLKNQKQSEQERIDSSVSVEMREKEQSIRQENKEELDQAYNEQRDLLRQIEQLENDLKQEKQEKENMKTEYVGPPKEESSDSKTWSEDVYPSHLQATETSKFSKIKFAVGCGISVLFLLLLTLGVSKLGGIQNELAKDNDFNQLSYLADLESDERYDKTAEKMQDFGYDQESIADMYMDHNYYVAALKTDKGILPEVYEYAESKENEDDHREVLEKVKNSGTLEGAYQKGVEARLAILDDNAEEVHDIATDSKIDNESAKKSIKYFIDNGSFDNAEALLKVYPNEKLSEELEKERTSDAKEEAKGLEDEIESLEKDIDDKDKEADDLDDDLDDAKKKEKKKVKKKIKKNDKEKDDLKKDLEEKNKKLEEVEKEI